MRLFAEAASFLRQPKTVNEHRFLGSANSSRVRMLVKLEALFSLVTDYSPTRSVISIFLSFTEANPRIEYARLCSSSVYWVCMICQI